MNLIERVMRVMTHINIGATLGLAAWVLWSGWQIVTSQITPAYRVAEIRELVSHAQGGDPVVLQLVPVQASGTQASCHPAASRQDPESLTTSEADL